MPLGDPAPTPPSLLGYHRPLAPSAAVKVSPLCLGTMNFGSAWYSSLRNVSIGDGEANEQARENRRLYQATGI